MRNAYIEPEDDGLPMRDSGPWVEEKLDILDRYINVFETSMKGKFPKRNYVDLFAGPGKNKIRDTGKVLLGSPLIALNTKYPFTNYYFIDSNNEVINTLTERCNLHPLTGRVNFLIGDCNVIVIKVVDQIQNYAPHSLNLAFLDPEGLEVKWSTIEKLGSLRRMDLIIHYPQAAITRNIKHYYEDKNHNLLDDFFGDRNWRKIYEDCSKKRQITSVHRPLMDYYKLKLVNLGYIEVIKDDESGYEPLIRNAKTHAPLYRLLFASKHSRGLDFWGKVTHRDVHGQKRLF
jgi:three-Cys-motif partner protein